jgi:N-acylneuraminate cytidylyltransferase/CMP-N,N'-diacetyllegionaminic acid synthase
VRQAVDSGLFDRVVVTSDAPEVLEHARAFGATDVINRPRELAVDTAGKIPAIVHAVREIEGLLGRDFSTIVDLDATSPLRNNNDIVGAVHLLESRSLESVITGTESRRSPYFNLVEVDPETGVVGLSKRVGDGFLRRQDVPRAFDMNASVYVWARDTFLAEPRVFYPTTQLYEMPPERSQDIDSELDFQIVSWLMQARER